MGQHRRTDTKQSIKQALTFLLVEKEFDHITVSDIAECAKINRGTFYLHYLDKFDLLSKLIKEIYSEISELLFVDESNYDYFEPLVEALRLFRSDRDFICAVLLRRPNDIHIELRGFLLQLIERRPELSKVMHQHPVLPSDYVTEFFIASVIGMITYWLTKGAVEEPEDFAQMMIESQTMSLCKKSYLAISDFVAINDSKI